MKNQNLLETSMYDRCFTLGPGPCGLRAGLAAQGGGHDLRGKVEEVSQVLDALIGEVPVEMAPGKLLLDVPTGLQRLNGKAQLPHYTDYHNKSVQNLGWYGSTMQKVSLGFLLR